MAEQQGGQADDQPIEPEVLAPRRVSAQRKRQLDPRNHRVKTVRQLSYMVRCYAMDRRRLRELALMEDRIRTNGRVGRSKSTVRYHDRPEVEIMLHRRDELQRMDVLIEEYDAKIRESGLQDDKLLEALKCISSLKQSQMIHMQRIEDVLNSLNKEIGKREMIMAKMAADMAAISLSVDQHKDKMALAAKAVAPSASELRTRLALKYGVSEEEVDKLLGAKAAQQEPEA